MVKNVKLGIMTDMYVDDVLKGAPNLESAMKLEDSVKAVLSEAGFEIRKKDFKLPRLVGRLPAHLQETTDEVTIKSADYSRNILGVKFEPKSRPLQFHSKTGRKNAIYKTPNTVGS